jgi:hypothetical protein
VRGEVRDVGEESGLLMLRTLRYRRRRLASAADISMRQHGHTSQRFVVVALLAILLLAGCQSRELGGLALPDGCRPAESPFDRRLSHGKNHMTDGTEITRFLAGRRQIGVTDDPYIRILTRELCKPCEYWFEENVSIEEMFPLEYLASATKGVCFGLQLKDGTVRYGAYRRRLTNPPRVNERQLSP